MLTIYNSLTRCKEEFKPITPGKVGMYVCGITVYDHCHVGHGRSLVSFDVVYRYLKHKGYDVTFVRNITDIDDKIIQRAQEKGQSIETLTHHYIQTLHEDTKTLNLLPPTKEPRATAHIPSIIALIQRLMDAGYAYVSDDGDVCYEVDKFAAYGKLSNKKTKDLLAGARVEVVKAKHSPLDFVLWKKAKPAEPSWPSPWGDGRPGWHIECSAMCMHELGEQFDIHGGGLDLKFPHHENEIAQSEAVTQKPLANYWMHAGLLQINGEKMSKSTGNFLTLADTFQQHDPETIRYFLLSSHYRSPLNYSEDNLHNAHKALGRLYQTLKDTPPDQAQPVLDSPWAQAFYEAMDDDFNTPIALSVLFQLSHEVNKTNDPALAATLKTLAAILGLLTSEPQTFLQEPVAGLEEAHLNQLLADRLDAKAQKDWARADAIRDQLTQLGIELEDGPQGTTWRKKL